MRVGVVVPVHGWAPYLAEALDAILAGGPETVVVVDDGSPEPIVLHPDHEASCRLVRREHRGGIAAARATGERALDPGVDWVASCDADDAWRPGKLAAQREALALEPGAAVCFGRAEIVGPDGRPTGERWADVPAGTWSPLPALYRRNPIPVSSAVVRRDALHAAGGYEGAFPNAAEDWDLWLRLARRGATFVSAPQARISYRRHAGGMTADVAALARAQLALHAAHADLVPRSVSWRARLDDRAALARDRARRAYRRLV